MSDPSNWPLSQSALRVTVPEDLRSELQRHPLSADCFTTAIGFYPEAKLHKMTRSGHDDFILIFCAEGRGSLRYEEKGYLIRMGDVFILPPNSVHTYAADNEAPWTVYWCHFQGSAAADFYHYIYDKQNEPVLSHMADIDFVQSFRSLVDLVRTRNQLRDYIHASNLFRHILTRIEWHSGLHKPVESGFPIEKIHQFMRANLNKALTLETLAGLTHSSKYHFARRYQAVTGQSPLKHFMEMKIEHACFLLEQTRLSISEIAAKLGYDDPLYFSRVFRRIQGQAPSHFRKRFLTKHEKGLFRKP